MIKHCSRLHPEVQSKFEAMNLYKLCNPNSRQSAGPIQIRSNERWLDFGIRRLDHAVGNVPELAPAVSYLYLHRILRICGIHDGGRRDQRSPTIPCLHHRLPTTPSRITARQQPHLAPLLANNLILAPPLVDNPSLAPPPPLSSI
jgi:hypothetical protein